MVGSIGLRVTGKTTHKKQHHYINAAATPLTTEPTPMLLSLCKLLQINDELTAISLTFIRKCLIAIDTAPGPVVFLYCHKLTRSYTTLNSPQGGKQGREMKYTAIIYKVTDGMELIVHGFRSIQGSGCVYVYKGFKNGVYFEIVSDSQHGQETFEAEYIGEGGTLKDIIKWINNPENHTNDKVYQNWLISINA